MSNVLIADEVSNLPMIDTILWCYRLFLQRNPENLEVVLRHLDNPSQSFANIRQEFLLSDEFQAQISQRTRQIAIDPRLLDSFPPFAGPGVEGFLTDFTGTRTRCAYWPDSYAGASGLVEGPPGTERFGLHDPAEWEGTLRSVLEAQSRFVAVELGAGWGPWLVASAKAAQWKGIEEIHLAGVEGAYSHYEYMVQHFRDNGLDPASHLLLHAVAGVQDGVAYFPKLHIPRDNWGAEASYLGANESENFEEVASISIETLLSKLPPVDLLHCDVQGAEGDVLSAGIHELSACVSRIVVGTHSRRIENQLMDLFGAHGWILENESPCRFFQQQDGSFQLVADGVQVWHNTKQASG